MNFVPQPDPHKQAIAELSAQIDHYLATGQRIQQIPAGVGADVPMFGTTSRTRKKKASASDASNQ
ncbi:hypothetical protein NPS29_16740 [Pseudomonas putida]|uniref:hypothetical protein n=1 Tax=Pseudomonas putida TaxID=303 RepID=UPI0023645BBE|nr:hypothetical protein [Pseudomonas putida]MDD1966978.1 hypothetical protein [Pseudomonas putida]